MGFFVFTNEKNKRTPISNIATIKIKLGRSRKRRTMNKKIDLSWLDLSKANSLKAK